MSTEQRLNNDLIEQTKQQIRALVNEIAQLSKSDITPEEFYNEFLTRVVSALAAVGGVVWTIEEQGRMALQYQINLQQTGLQHDENMQKQHGQLLRQTLTGGEPILVPPHSGSAPGEDQVANPTEFLLVMGPIKTDLETVGLVEIFQRPDSGINTQKGYLRFLSQMCDLAADFMKSRQLRHFSDRQVMWSRLEDFTRIIHGSLDSRLTAYTIANEGRRLIECDRVSVALRKGRKCRIEAVSGQDTFDKRSNTIRLLGELATRVVEVNEPIWYTGDTSNMAPQIEDAIHDYVDESHSKTVAVLPLLRPEPSEEEQDPDNPIPPQPPVGALIVEQIEDSRLPERVRQRIDVVANHSSLAMANAMEHQSLFLMPLWRTLGKSRWLIEASRLPKTVSISIAILILILCMFIVPWDFELESNGTLEPVLRSEVFALETGNIKKVLVRHGDKVKKGQLLAEMTNVEVETKLREIEGNLDSTTQRLRAQEYLVYAQRDSSSEDRNKLLGDVQALKEEKNSLDAQLTLYREKYNDLKVISPRAGQVVTWDIENLLDGRPVQRGQVLMQIADTKGQWQLELQMPEDRMGYLVDAQDEMGDDLKVTFVMATDPGREFVGKIKETHYSAEVRGEEGNTVLIKVDISDINPTDLPNLMPGAEVKAKVYCGQRSIAYCLFHDLWAFIQSRILFRL